jgi:hypothetical protein
MPLLVYRLSLLSQHNTPNIAFEAETKKTKNRKVVAKRRRKKITAIPATGNNPWPGM